MAPYPQSRTFGDSSFGSALGYAFTNPRPKSWITSSFILDDNFLKPEQAIAQELHLTESLRESGHDLKK
jgi:hypothetical protein